MTQVTIDDVPNRLSGLGDVDSLGPLDALAGRSQSGSGGGRSGGDGSRGGGSGGDRRGGSNRGRRSSDGLGGASSGGGSGGGRRSGGGSRAGSARAGARRRSGAGEAGGQVAALDVDAREVEVLGGVLVAVAGELEDTDVPVGAVGADAGADGLDGLDELVGAGRVPEADGAGVKVDLVGKVVPDAGLEGGVPLALRVGVPPQLVVGLARGARDPAVLELGEVRLEEGDLVLAVDRGGVGLLALHGEVVVQRARGDGARVRHGGDQLGAAHVLSVPVGGGVEGDLGALGGTGPGGVGREVEVLGGVGVTVDVPLVGAGLVGPGPVGQVGDGQVVEAAIPHRGSGSGQTHEVGGESSEGGLLHHLDRGVVNNLLVDV